MDTVPAPRSGTTNLATTGVAGVGTAARDWRRRAACLELGYDFFFEAAHRAEALHVCRSHCPVLPDCLAFTQRLRPVPSDCVMGGRTWPVMYRDRRTAVTHPAASCPLCRRRRR